MACAASTPAKRRAKATGSVRPVKQFTGHTAKLPAGLCDTDHSHGMPSPIKWLALYLPTLMVLMWQHMNRACSFCGCGIRSQGAHLEAKVLKQTKVVHVPPLRVAQHCETQGEGLATYQ